MRFDDWVDSERERLRSRSHLREPRTIASVSGAHIEIEGRTCLSLCSNDYLGFAGHPALRAALIDGAATHGAGAGASRLVSGELGIHRSAETALAAFVGAESALLFPSGYAANVGALPALFPRDAVLFSDSLNHASLIDGCRLSRAKVVVYPHRDMDALDAALALHRKDHAVAGIVSESLFSMDGDEAPLRTLAALAERHDAALVIDEAHALGTLGPRGRGLCARDGVTPDALVGTLGKAFGLAGAFVATSSAARALLVTHARSFVFSTGVLPSLAAAIEPATRLVDQADAERERALRHAERLRTALTSLGYSVLPGGSSIVPVVLGPEARTLAMSRALFELGIFAQAIRPPTVPEGTSRLRLVATAALGDADLDRAIGAFAQLASLYACAASS